MRYLYFYSHLRQDSNKIKQGLLKAIPHMHLLYFTVGKPKPDKEMIIFSRHRGYLRKSKISGWSQSELDRIFIPINQNCTIT